MEVDLWHKQDERGVQDIMDDSLIQWTKSKWWEKQWNPVIGCKPCSPACENCYAASWAKRFGQPFEPHSSSQERPPRKGVVFCGNMTDLFGEWVEVPMEPIFQTAKSANADATYLYLTKRVECMCAMLNSIVMAQRGVNLTGLPFTDPRIFHNHYFGFTAENQSWYDRRRMQCVDMPGWVNSWLSCEPLLGSINYLLLNDPAVKSRTKWVVVGCESGPNRRPCKIEWVESIVEQCLTAGVPVFVKQIDIGGKCVTDINKFPKHLQIRQVPWAKNGGAW